jgi:transcriptional regulator with XRE-family HTH domain
MNKLKSINSTESGRLREWLINQRKAQGLSIRGLAERLGWSSSIVGKIETGDRRLDVIEYMEVCKALEASPHEGLEFITRPRVLLPR